MKLYLRLLGYTRPYAGYFLVSLLGFLIFASAQPMFAVVLKYFVDGISNPSFQPLLGAPVVGDIPILYLVPLLVILIAVWQGVGTYIGSVFIARVSLGVVQDLRTGLFEKLLLLPNQFFDNHNSGHLVARIIYNVSQVTGAATGAVKVIFKDGLTVLFLLGYLFWSNWKLTLVIAVVLPGVVWMVQRANKKFRKQSGRIQASVGEITHIASETIQGYRVVRGFGGEKLEQQRFREAAARSYASELKMVRTSSAFTPLLQVLIYSTMATLFLLVVVFRGDATAGDLVAYVTAAGLLPKPARALSEVSAIIQKGLAAADSIFDQLDEATEPDLGLIQTDRVRGEIEFRNVSFRYGATGEQVLDDVSFSVEPGMMVALVGRSGSGKSTIASLIPRFYNGWDGQILLDGVSIDQYRLTSLRRQLSLVTQTTVLFNDTIAKNIAYGDLANASRDDIRSAAQAAHATEFIDRLPDGLDTLVGENGVLLSGGQRQRIAIARAILKNAPVLILDEATSALDTESERSIQLALESASRGRTTLVIAHRLSTIERADLILVVEEGKIVERGSHADLIRQGGIYAGLHAMQFSDLSKGV